MFLLLMTLAFGGDINLGDIILSHIWEPSIDTNSSDGECRAKAKTASVEKRDVEPFYLSLYLCSAFSAFQHESLIDT